MSKAIDLENGLPAIKTWVEGKLALKAPLASPALTGTPTAPTAETNDSSTKIATTAFVNAAITAASIDVDDALSSTSENPVQNKVINSALAGKVDTESGKGLSTNDYTTAEKNKLAGIDTGANVNVIESVKVNGTALTVTSKAVNVPKATNSIYGAIILSDSTDGTAAAASGGTAATPKAVADALAAATGAIPDASSADPEMDGTAASGSSDDYARADHVHPTDTSRAPVSHAVTATTYGAGSSTNYGHVKLSDATNGTAAAASGGTAATPKAVADALAAATGAIPAAATTAPVMDGTAAVGSSAKYAKEDHVHPTDTSRAPTSHAASTTTYGAGTGTNYGHVKLSDATDGTAAASSGGTAATPKAVADALSAAKTYADGKVSGLYTYKGSVATYADLPGSPSTGDVYNVEAAYNDYPAGTNWAYTGSAWDALGGSFTITYATAAEVTAVLEA